VVFFQRFICLPTARLMWIAFFCLFQFGRDLLFLTNFKSDKYCGSREKLTKKETLYQESKPRVYVESQDREMDVWYGPELMCGGSKLSISSCRLSLKPPSKDNGFRPRNLTLIATVFKKGCSSEDPYFRPCPKTQVTLI